MRHTCEHCETAYEIPDDKVAGKRAKVRCQRCNGTMLVIGPRPRGGHLGATWWAALDGWAEGPLREDEVLAEVAAGRIHAHTTMWCKGMPTWARVAESATLAWVYAAVMQGPDPFTRAALLSDGHGWFPDPTLKSGIILLGDEAQESLERLAQERAALREKTASLTIDRRAVGTRARRAALHAPLAAASIGLASAAAGVGWFLVQALA